MTSTLSSRALAIALALSFGAAGVGCEIVASFDRSLIPPGEAGSPDAGYFPEADGGLDSATGPDAGSPDGTVAEGGEDAGADSSLPAEAGKDSGGGDTGVADSGGGDTGVADSGGRDTSVADTGTPDTGPPDTGTPSEDASDDAGG